MFLSTISAWPDKVASLCGQWDYASSALFRHAYLELPHSCAGLRCSVSQLEHLVGIKEPLHNVPCSECNTVFVPGFLVLPDFPAWR